MKKERIIYLDIVKSIAIFLVCIFLFSLSGDISFNAHLTKTVILKRFLRGLCSMGVPLFFMAAGAVYSLKKAEISKSIKLLIDYFFCRFLTLAIILIYNGRCLDVDTIINLLTDTFLLTEKNGIDVNHLWFIPCFLCVQILAPFFIEVGGIRKQKSLWE